MWQTVAIGGLLLGATSSLHCVGMCGPIALALPISYFNKLQQYIAGILYNIGRVVGYASFGFLLALLGKNIFTFHTQNWLSIIGGLLIIIGVFYNNFYQKKINIPVLDVLEKKVRKSIVYFFSQKKMYAFFMIGVLNALLPCGMVYIALAAAVSFHTPMFSALFIFFFGAGTLPLMIALFFTGIQIKIQLRKYVVRYSPYAMMLVGVFLITRGLFFSINITIENKGVMHYIISCF
jgi:uncharacterized protein